MLHVVRQVKKHDWTSMNRSELQGLGVLATAWMLRTKLIEVLQVRRNCWAAQRKPACALHGTKQLLLIFHFPKCWYSYKLWRKKEVPQMHQERLFSFIFMNLDKRELDMNLEKCRLKFILPIMMLSASVNWLLLTDPFLSLVLCKVLFLRELLFTEQFRLFFVLTALWFPLH